MTEQEWLTCAEPAKLLAALHRRDQARDRKLRLLAVACCRRILHLTHRDFDVRAVDTAERFADRKVSKKDLRALSKEAARMPNGFSIAPSAQAARDAAVLTLVESMWGNNSASASFASVSMASASRAVAFAAVPSINVFPLSLSYNAGTDWNNAQSAEERVQAKLLQDVIGNPFRPVTVNASWLTSTVISVATEIYDERDFDRLPILADALEDAGCDHADILNHCRQPGDHVRGCWLVDLLLDKR